MAKKAKSSKSNGESVSGYFRRAFEENPAFLRPGSNAKILKKWLKDHPGHTEVPKNVKAGLSNLKSVLRSKGRKTAKKAAKASTAAATTPRVSAVTAKVPAQATTSKLEKLEELIDDAYIYARHLDPQGLETVINLLRKARTNVVWKMGE